MKGGGGVKVGYNINNSMDIAMLLYKLINQIRAVDCQISYTHP